MAEIQMPRLSDSMEEGTILKWLKSAGDDVVRGEALVEIETDKATMTYESDATGRLEIVAAEGDTLPIGAVIARLGGAADPTDQAGAAAAHGGEPSAAAGAEAGGGASPPAGAHDGGEASAAAAGGHDGGEPSAAAGVQGAPPAVAAPEPLADAVTDLARAGGAEPGPAAGPRSTGAGERVRASPIARRIARERGVDLGSVRGTGPGGRVVRADIEREGASRPTAQAPAARFAPASPPPAGTASPPPPAPPAPPPPPAGTASPPAPAPPAPPTPPAPAPAVSSAAAEPEATVQRTGEAGSGKGITTTQEPTRAQQVVARRMASSKATIPEFTLHAEIDMERCVELRGRLRALPGERVAPSYNDIVVKACGLALREHPRANGAWRDGRFELFSRINVGVAVAGEGVLVVPTVFDADLKSLEEIAGETRRLAGRVRDGQVTPPELSGATFTVSNLGMFGVKSFTAVINPPQAAILAVGAVTQRAVAVDGELAVRHAMDVTLACDHRILYGADAARFLARLRELIEEPLALLR